MALWGITVNTACLWIKTYSAIVSSWKLNIWAKSQQKNFATSGYCLCRGSVYLGWNTGQLWQAKWRNKLPSMEQGQQSWHEWKYRICSSRIVPFPKTVCIARQRGELAFLLCGIHKSLMGMKKWQTTSSGNGL